MTGGMRNLGQLVPKEKNNTTDFHEWATVTQASPLRIRVDTDTDPLPFTPQSNVSGLVVNDRVLVLFMANAIPSNRARRVVIIGKPI